jgi:ketosteroid isomerase-like protein
MAAGSTMVDSAVSRVYNALAGGCLIMRKGFAWCVVLGMALSLVACGGSAPKEEFGRADAEQITKLVRDLVAAYNAKDVEKIGTFFSGNASVMPANRSTLNGVDAVKGFYKERVTTEGATNLAIEMLSVQGQGTLAYFAGTFSLDLKPEAGPQRHDRGKVIWILRKLGGQWKFEYQMMSSDLPPPPPPEPEPDPKAKK